MVILIVVHRMEIDLLSSTEKISWINAAFIEQIDDYQNSKISDGSKIIFKSGRSIIVRESPRMVWTKVRNEIRDIEVDKEIVDEIIDEIIEDEDIEDDEETEIEE